MCKLFPYAKKNNNKVNKLQPAVVGPRESTLSKRRKWDKELVSVKKKKRKGRREKGGKKEGKEVANVNSMTLFLPSSKAGREN